MKALILSLFYLGISTPFFAQNTKKILPPKNKIVYDTLMVYDTIFVTDTIRLLKNRAPVSALEKLPVQNILLQIERKNEENENFLLINKNFAATFSSNRILLSENKNNHFTTKNSDKMKKIGFFGVVFFAFQNMVVAQNNLSISLGGGAYFHQADEVVYDSYLRTSGTDKANLAATFNLGVNGFRNIGNTPLAIGASLQYNYLLRSDFKPYTHDPKFADFINTYEDFKKNYHMFSLPIFVQWDKWLIKPRIGAEYSLRLSPKTSSVISGNTTSLESFYLPFNNISALAGFDVKLSKKAKVRLTYTKGLRSEKLHQPKGSQFSVGMQRFEASILYSFQ
jgi:hypothetical protein